MLIRYIGGYEMNLLEFIPLFAEAVALTNSISVLFPQLEERFIE
jgi:hypothetical protein